MLPAGRSGTLVDATCTSPAAIKELPSSSFWVSAASFSSSTGSGGAVDPSQDMWMVFALHRLFFDAWSRFYDLPAV